MYIIKRKTTTPWYDYEITKLSKTRDFLFKRARIKNDDTSWKDYKIARNRVTYLIKAKRKQYFSNNIERCKDNKKLMWKFLKKAIDGKSSITRLKSMIIDNEMVTDSKLIASKYNQYSLESLDNLIPLPKSTMVMNGVPIAEIFVFQEITQSVVQSEIKSVGTGTSSDFLNKRLIIEWGYIVYEALTQLINLSFETGIFPNSWKNSVVIPVRKVPKAEHPSDFRPINTLLFAEKIMERVVK